MREVNVYDSDGNTIRLLVQWDTDVVIYLIDDEITTSYPVHFFNANSDEALVVESEYSNEMLSAKIPNTLLTESLTIIGYVYKTDSDGSRSVYGFKIPIRKRPQPSDYVYVESDDYVSIEAVLSECKTYASAAAQSANSASSYSTLSKSYAVGGTGTRTNEEVDNAKYYYTQAKEAAEDADASADSASTSSTSAGEYASAAAQSANSASSYSTLAQSYAEDVASQKDEISDIISQSLLASSDEILESIKSYFEQAEALYRSCTVICDGEIPARRARTIIEIDCFTISRKLTGYTGIDFDGGTPAIRLLGE